MSYEAYKFPREMPRTKRSPTKALLEMPRGSLWRRVVGEFRAIGRRLFFRSYL